MIRVNYVTSSDFKKEEISFLEDYKLDDNSKIKDNFEFKIYKNPIHERLEVDIEKMVSFEVKEAYKEIRVPCIVEHAGLIFSKYKHIGYPGGLTKPMWNTLGNNFLIETNSANEEVIAEAVIAYCDGKMVKTFKGQTEGKLSSKPKGNRKFYWDTIFIPKEVEDKTYAEISDSNGIAEKLKYSQSTKALLKFLKYLKENPSYEFWN